jgi:hypothetical protein
VEQDWGFHGYAEFERDPDTGFVPEFPGRGASWHRRVRITHQKHSAITTLSPAIMILLTHRLWFLVHEMRPARLLATGKAASISGYAPKVSCYNHGCGRFGYCG